MTTENALQLAQEVREAQSEARADDEQTAFAEGMAILSLQNLVADWGLDFIEQELATIRASIVDPTCDRCHNWNQRYNICQLRAEASLHQLPTTHAKTCPFWQDIGF